MGTRPTVRLALGREERKVRRGATSLKISKEERKPERWRVKSWCGAGAGAGVSRPAVVVRVGILLSAGEELCRALNGSTRALATAIVISNAQYG